MTHEEVLFVSIPTVGYHRMNALSGIVCMDVEYLLESLTIIH